MIKKGSSEIFGDELEKFWEKFDKFGLMTKKKVVRNFGRQIEICF